jgi:hypothetical protein
MNMLEYLLSNLAEEASEVAHAAAKTQRFGLEDRYEGSTNRERLLAELHDIRTVADILLEHIGESAEFGHDHCEADLRKRLKMSKWMEHAKRNGTLTP